MDVKTCLEKLGYVGVLNFATVDEDGGPQVRNISAVHYEGADIYFLTARGKSFARQLYRDGRVQISGYTRYKETIRISGIALEVPEEEQLQWRDILYREQPYLENVYPGETKNIDTIFVIKNYTIEYFCLSTRPITREYFAVGDGILKPKGYRITEACIGCGKCARVCPQKAVYKVTDKDVGNVEDETVYKALDKAEDKSGDKSGDKATGKGGSRATLNPYIIRQNNCLQCGNCFENCPVKAIRRH